MYFGVLLVGLVLSLNGAFVKANVETIDSDKSIVCSGMYSQEDWGGKTPPYIEVSLREGKKVHVSIFDYQDHVFIGKMANDVLFKYCTQSAVDAGLCSQEELGNYLLSNSYQDPETGEERKPANEIQVFTLTEDAKTNDPKYKVAKTGFYCIISRSDEDEQYKANVEYRNTFGHLPAAEINELPLYGLLAIAYLVAMALYSFAVWKHKHELLLLQKYILAFFVFLTIDTILIWFYFDIRNERGSTTGTNLFMVFVSFMNAGKVSFSCFFLLVVALGYGIVYPKLNRMCMRKIQAFTLLTFASSIAFLVCNYVTNPESKSIIPFITMLPVALCLIVFYVMIVKSLGHTMVYLQEQRQIVKFKMYQKFLAAIYFSICAVFGGFMATSFMVIGMNTDEMIEQYWKTRFLMDFWPSMVYFMIFVVLAFMWRPTDTSYMLACSQQLPTDPENVTDFDLDDLHSLEEGGFGNHDRTHTNAGAGQVHDDDLNFSDDENTRQHPIHGRAQK